MVYRWDSETLSKTSLKNGLDSLPVGLLFYWKGGMVKLVNARMDAIAHLINHEGIYNGNDFWKMIYSRNMSLDTEKTENENECLVRLEDGAVYSFKRNICFFEEHELVEIIASDISEEQLLNEKLKIKRIKADEIKNRLKDLNSDIEKMTVEKEILETKSKVHDDLGKTLIMSKRCLETKDEKLAADVIRQWKLNTMLLRGEENDDELFEYSNVLREIQKLGMNVRVEGIMPREPEQKRLLVLALRTCATNAMRHGEASEMTVRVSNSIERNIVSIKEKDFLKVEIANDGKLPEGEFKEGGGLSNLRSTVERNGGIMNVETKDHFTVILRLPVGRQKSSGL